MNSPAISPGQSDPSGPQPAANDPIIDGEDQCQTCVHIKDKANGWCAIHAERPAGTCPDWKPVNLQS